MLHRTFVILLIHIQAQVPGKWDIYWPTAGLLVVTGVAVVSALLTLKAIRDQVAEMQKSSVQTDALIEEQIAQSRSLERWVSEASRSATAMEEVSRHIQVSAATASVSSLNQQMRAYLCAVIGGGVFQERSKNLKFQASVSIINAGPTPAYKVRFKTDAAILPIPLPEDFSFPLPERMNGGPLVGPRQQTNLNAIVPDFVDDTEVDGIKRGQDKGLYAWGVVEYEDVFGNPRLTKFCQIYTFLPDGKVWGYYTDRHNEAT